MSSPRDTEKRRGASPWGNELNSESSGISDETEGRHASGNRPIVFETGRRTGEGGLAGMRGHDEVKVRGRIAEAGKRSL